MRDSIKYRKEAKKREENNYLDRKMASTVIGKKANKLGKTCKCGF